MQHDVFAETLLRFDPRAGEVVGLLADSWEASNEFKTWTLNLRKGIPFQFGWGEVTTADVVHTFELLVREDSLSTLKNTGVEPGNP